MLKPIDPPQSLSSKLQDTFSAVSDAAAEDLSNWADELTESEMKSLGDPRNWVRPVVALTAGGIATGALVILEMRRRGRQPSSRFRALSDGVRSRTRF